MVILNQAELKAAIEALLFMAIDPLQVKELKNVLGIKEKKVEKLLEELSDDYLAQDRGVKLVMINKGYQFQTKSEYRSLVKELHKPQMNNVLSKAALETLAIIAYKQPVTRAEVEDIRGVNVEKALKTLQKRGLINEQGRKDTIGNPILYGTTDKFLECMGMNDLDGLPKPKEFNQLTEDEINDK